MPLREPRHLLPGAAAFAAALLVALLGLNAGADEPAAPPDDGTVELQLLGVNDFHGHLEPPAPGLGGAAWLGAHLDRATLSHPDRTITVHAGDMIGASPLISSHFHDEPAIEATNRMGFDVGAVGNHEFDEGGAELMRVLQASRYQWLAANTVDPATGAPVLTPYKVIERAGVRVGFIGVTTDDTPTWLLPEFKREYRFLDISETVNRWVPELRARGIEAIVVLAHSGAFQKGESAVGEIADETAQMDDAVDVVVAGHTHSELNFTVDGKLVVESLAYGTGYDRVAITVDRVTGEVVGSPASWPPPSTSASHLIRTWPPSSLSMPSVWRRSATAWWASSTTRSTRTSSASWLPTPSARTPGGRGVRQSGQYASSGLDASEVTYAEAFLVHSTSTRSCA